MENLSADRDRIVVDERNLRLLINNTDDPIWLVDRNCMILECNGAFRRWVQCFIGEELTSGDNVLFDGKNLIYHNKFEMCYSLALSGKAFKTVEDMTIDDATHYTSVNFQPVVNEAGEVIGVACYARDITEQRKHLLRIEQQNTALREIAFIESHKIRGPVATILGLEQFYNYDDLTDPINKEIMEGIKTLSLDLDTFIRQVVRMSNEIGI